MAKPRLVSAGRVYATLTCTLIDVAIGQTHVQGRGVSLEECVADLVHNTIEAAESLREAAAERDKASGIRSADTKVR